MLQQQHQTHHHQPTFWGQVEYHRDFGTSGFQTHFPLQGGFDHLCGSFTSAEGVVLGSSQEGARWVRSTTGASGSKAQVGALRTPKPRRSG